jgi:hypothetical protein
LSARRRGRCRCQAEPARRCAAHPHV